jgi:hypothetical protein
VPLIQRSCDWRAGGRGDQEHDLCARFRELL